MPASAAGAAAAAWRAFLASGGSLSTYAAYKARYDPPHLVWDLDNTLLCSVTPHPGGAEKDGTAKACVYPSDPSTYFDQIDDDFAYEPGVPNTRTFWRPGARTALSICGLFGVQHVCTAAQGTYTANVLRELDPDGTIFNSVIHRDAAPGIIKAGKDLSLVTNRMDRALLFDDRTRNFAPQGGTNGIHVAPYDKVGEDRAAELREAARLVGISVLALLAPDARDVSKWFRSEEHRRTFPDILEAPTSS